MSWSTIANHYPHLQLAVQQFTAIPDGSVLVSH